MHRPSLILVVLAACNSDQPDARIAPPLPDAAPAVDASPPDAVVPDANPVVLRGSYLVNAVAACTDCHTPRLPTGAPDMTKFLSGVECFVDILPGVAGGCLNSRNLTNHETGLKNFTDDQIKTMFQLGKRPDGTILFDVMPYYLLHQLTDDDANAIVAYLRTVPPVDHTVPPSDPPFNDPVQATPIQDSDFPPAAGNAPGTTLESATRGRYLASLVCIDCHTKDNAFGSAVPKDWTKAFAGGQDFMLGIPGLPADIISRNLTSDATGLMGWTVDDVKKVLFMGKDKGNQMLCPPMPFGPMGAFGHLTDADATDIANYILNLPPIVNDVGEECVLPQ